MAARQVREVVVVVHWMAETKACSIIIPVLNEARHLPRQLEALQRWRHAGHEIIVVDGGSSDASIDIATPLVDQVVRSKKGRAVQMNAGAAQAVNSWLVFLHVDTLFSDTAMNSLQIALLRKGISWGRFNVRLSGSHLLFTIISRLMNIRSRLTGIVTGDQVIFVSKNIFNEVKGFPDIALMEDISLSSHLKKIAPPYCVPDTVTTSSRRWQEHGIIKTIFMMWSLRLRYFFGEKPSVLAERYERISK